ncbi:MAG: glycosyltransferase family 39 protein [Proteobacteria bacterium]|nr:glycosyltransferase family 39 protein [Pseudomonadota bacterium]MBS0574459.1 glycosyltransferase family 39 protein [Pseudomonadota bacterium]
MTDGGRRDYAVLALILALALALRLYGLNGPLWFDEITTVDTHLRLGWGEMMQSYSMNHHYLHNLAAKAAMQIFGESPWAIRLPALLFGLSAIAAMWVLVRRATDSGTAHATALLLALSYHHIWFSQNARGYTGMALFSTIGFLLFLSGLKDGRWRSWLWFAAAMAATIFTHLTGAFFFVTLGLVWLWRVVAAWRRGALDRDLIIKPFTGFLIGGLVTIALYAPLLPSLLRTVGGVAETSAGDPMQEYQSPLWTAYEAIRTGVGHAGPLVTLIGLGVLALSLLGAVALRRRAPLIAPVTFGHILLSVALLLAMGMRIWPRFFFTDIAFLLFLIVCGVQLVCFSTGPMLGRWLYRLALIGMVLVSGAMAARNYMAPKQDMAGAYRFAEAHRQPGERIYTIAYAAEVYRTHFHADWGAIFTEADYRAALDAPGPLTIVVVFPDRSFRSLPSLEADLSSGRLRKEAYLPGTLGDGGIVILHRDAAAGTAGGSGG